MVRKSILIIEDDETVQQMLRLILERAGFAIEISSNGDCIYQPRDAWPDLFLLDKQLLGHDGLEICRYIKGHPDAGQIPVIILSATPGIEPLALDAGADDFMEKPLNTTDLMAKVAHFLK